MSRTGNYKAGWKSRAEVKAVYWEVKGGGNMLSDDIEKLAVLSAELREDVRQAYETLLERNGLDPILHMPKLSIYGDLLKVEAVPRRFVQFEGD